MKDRLGLGVVLGQMERTGEVKGCDGSRGKVNGRWGWAAHLISWRKR